jgi:hypothetical protein
MTLLESGCHEPLKAGVHGAVGALALICFGYNAAAFVARRERHLARNVVFYGLVVAVEIAHVVHHCRATSQQPSSFPPQSRSIR